MSRIRSYFTIVLTEPNEAKYTPQREEKIVAHSKVCLCIESSHLSHYNEIWHISQIFVMKRALLYTKPSLIMRGAACSYLTHVSVPTSLVGRNFAMLNAHYGHILEHYGTVFIHHIER